MSPPCQQFDLRSELTDAAWEAHREGCPSCRDQWTMDLEFRRAFAAPLPALSSGFEQALHQRLRAEDARGANPRGLGRFLMPVYWLGAAAVSLFIVAGIEWPAGAGFSSAAILVSLLTLGVPAFFLTRQFGLSFYELVFISAAKRPADQMFFPARE
ncbi:MAG: hypothetical protein V3T72_14150 [Thermoanaerobaculia bacterium]